MPKEDAQPPRPLREAHSVVEVAGAAMAAGQGMTEWPGRPATRLFWRKAEMFLIEAERDGRVLPRCPKCDHRPLLTWADPASPMRSRGEYGPAELPSPTGVMCPRCGWKRQDLRSVRHEFACRCGRYMGPIFVLETRKLGKYVCFACAAKRRGRGLNPNPHVKVRYEVWCGGGCGSLQGWCDLPETVPLTHQASGYLCMTCAKSPKGRNEIMSGSAILVAMK